MKVLPLIAACALTAVTLCMVTSAHADTLYDWSFNAGVNDNGSGTLTINTMDVITNIGGSGIFDGSSGTNFTGPLTAGTFPPSPFPPNDNLLFPNAGANAQLDGNGVSFTITGGIDVNLFCQSGSCYDFVSTINDSGSPGTFSATLAPTPLPAALPLFATGLGGLGLLGWRRKRKAQAVA